MKVSEICDNKNFWKNVKPIFNEKRVSTNSITLIENKCAIDDDQTIANIFGDYFKNAVKHLNIEPYELFSFDDYFLKEDLIDNDPINKAIRKYENHPSILKIKENYQSTRERFSFSSTVLEEVAIEIKALDTKKLAPLTQSQLN